MTISTSDSYRKGNITPSRCSGLLNSTYKVKNIYVLTYTQLQNQLLTKSLLDIRSVYVLLRMCVRVCVGSAVPPGCPEMNWQLETLWLQGKASRARDGDKEEGERERERKERQQDTTTNTKGGQARQSVANSHFIFVMLTVRKESERKSSLWHAPFAALLLVSPPLPRTLFLNNTLEWRTILLLTLPPPLDSVSIQGSCEQGLKPLLATLNSPLCCLCNYFSFKSIIRTKSEVKWQAPHGHNFLQQACANSTDLLPAHLQMSQNAREFIHTFIVLFLESNKSSILPKKYKLYNFVLKKNNSATRNIYYQLFF